MPATVVYRDEAEKPDGSRYEMVAWRVPVSEDFPQGLKYSFQYMDADGDTLLRYDNAPYPWTSADTIDTRPKAPSRPWSSPASPPWLKSSKPR
jgi:hypothetical protein